MDHSRDRVLGCILGQAIGDALGEPGEFSLSFPRELPGLSPLDNRFTDDTQMMAAIAEALLAVPPAPHSNEGFMVELCKRFVEWGNNPLGGSHRAPGRACLQAVRNLQDGVPWNRAGGLSAKGNGAFTRENGDDFATVPATAAAIFFNTRYRNFPEIIEHCALWTGDCDTTTAIAGAIAGSRFGAGAIPLEWRRDIEMTAYFHDLADRIWLSSQPLQPRE
jgi:ADP-ribosylglycohydrolase